MKNRLLRSGFLAVAIAAGALTAAPSAAQGLPVGFSLARVWDDPVSPPPTVPGLICPSEVEWQRWVQRGVVSSMPVVYHRAFPGEGPGPGNLIGARLCTLGNRYIYQFHRLRGSATEWRNVDALTGEIYQVLPTP